MVLASIARKAIKKDGNNLGQEEYKFFGLDTHAVPPISFIKSQVNIINKSPWLLGTTSFRTTTLKALKLYTNNINKYYNSNKSVVKAESKRLLKTLMTAYYSNHRLKSHISIHDNRRYTNVKTDTAIISGTTDHVIRYRDFPKDPQCNGYALVVWHDKDIGAELEFKDFAQVVLVYIHYSRI